MVLLKVEQVRGKNTVNRMQLLVPGSWSLNDNIRFKHKADIIGPKRK